jgi:hypothetical protein
VKIFDPYWWDGPKVIIALIVGALAIDSISAVWGERRPVGGFFEEIIARALNFGMPIAAVAAGFMGGAKVAERTKQTWLGWVAGIALFMFIGAGSYFVIEQIPGVDWRYERIQDARDGY